MKISRVGRKQYTINQVVCVLLFLKNKTKKINYIYLFEMSDSMWNQTSGHLKWNK